MNASERRGTPAPLMLVGSVPFETAEQVFRTCGPPLGPYLSSIPDGEVGERRRWITRLHYQVFNGHADLEVLRRPRHDNGVERLLPHDESDAWQFAVVDGVPRVRFDMLGWRLGFAQAAISSYFVFRTLRNEGVLPSHLRFQVSLPMVNSVVASRTFPRLDDLARVRPGYEEALLAELGSILKNIPARDLSIQWDASWEVTDVNGGIPELTPADAVERNVEQVSRLSPAIPEEVHLGYHLCFGTFGGWPRFAPDDLDRTVALANAMIAASGRRVDWIHLPTLDRVDDAFYAPLARLAPRGARIFLGAIHNMGRFDQRLAIARRYLPEFGLAAPCGFGRTPPEDIPGLIDNHLRVAQRSGS
jgi:hypothetical protein